VTAVKGRLLPFKRLPCLHCWGRAAKLRVICIIACISDSGAWVHELILCDAARWTPSVPVCLHINRGTWPLHICL